MELCSSKGRYIGCREESYRHRLRRVHFADGNFECQHKEYHSQALRPDWINPRCERPADGFSWFSWAEVRPHFLVCPHPKEAAGLLGTYFL